MNAEETAQNYQADLEFLRHAQEVKEPSVRNAERARAVAASDWSDAEYAHWNLYRAMRLNTISRMVAGKPRPMIGVTDKIRKQQALQQQQYQETAAMVAEQGVDPAMVEEPFSYDNIVSELEDELEVTYSREMLAALLRDVNGESCDAGNSYLYIDPWTGDIQFVSFFDAWFDNALAKVSAPEEGRYIFWRCTMDENLFNLVYEKDLEALGIKAQAGGEPLEGRTIVGSNPSQHFKLREETSGIVQETFTGSTRETKGDISPSEEGLVVYYKSLIQTGDYESGWVYKVWYEDKPIRTKEWPANIGPPTIYCWAADSLTNQFYQPSDLNHVRGYQTTIDAILARVRDNSRTFGQAPLTMTQESYRLNNGHIKLGDADVFLHAPGDEVKFMEPPVLPAQYMEFVNMLVEFARSTELPDVLQGQTDQTDVQSGVAIDKLTREADQRMQLRRNNQEENLRKIGKTLCKIIYLRKLEEARALAAQQVSVSQQQQWEMADTQMVAEAGLYGVPYQPVPQPEPVAPEMIDDETAMQFMGPLAGLTLEMIDSDLVFSWEIEPELSSVERMQELLSAFQAAALIPGVNMDGAAFLKMAGKIARQTRLAEDLLATYTEVQPMIQMAQMQQAALAAEQGGNEEADNAGA